MFATIGRTWGLGKASWAVLQKDRELIIFPILSFLSIAIVAAIFFSIALAAGTVDRLDTGGVEGQTVQDQIKLIDVVIGVLFIVAATYAGIFFNAALIAAAMQRLKGGDPNVGSGIRAVLPHAHSILGWAIISATVGILLRVLRSKTDSFIGKIAIDLVGGVWAYITFFVVPVLVLNGVGPIGAIKESAGLFKRTWGEQFTASFGFGLFYMAAMLAGFALGGIVASANIVAGIIVGVLVIGLATAVVSAMEAIFKAALFQYAFEGRTPAGFEDQNLRESYRRVF